MKNRNRARIIYNDEFDSFDVEISKNGEWTLDCRYPCVCKEGQATLAANYIHFGILRQIADLNWMGYDVEVLE